MINRDLRAAESRLSAAFLRALLTSFSEKPWTDDEGQDISEYAVMLAVILVPVVGTIRLVGSNANKAFSRRCQFASVQIPARGDVLATSVKHVNKFSENPDRPRGGESEVNLAMLCAGSHRGDAPQKTGPPGMWFPKLIRDGNDRYEDNRERRKGDRRNGRPCFLN